MDPSWRIDSLFWQILNRGKRSILLDLKQTDQRESMLRLLDESQLLVENMRPGKLEALGLSPEYLWSRNPALVILRISGFGQTGPYAHKPGFATVAEAMSGLANIIGEEAAHRFCRRSR